MDISVSNVNRVNNAYARQTTFGTVIKRKSYKEALKVKEKKKPLAYKNFRDWVDKFTERQNGKPGYVYLKSDDRNRFFVTVNVSSESRHFSPRLWERGYSTKFLERAEKYINRIA